MRRHDLRVVALGGGHGLHASLAALRRVVVNPTAVVTVADNGGSSGRLRGEFGVLPPGDLRMALAALCGDDEWGRTWERVLQHRFAGDGEMNGHVVGNLLIVSLWELLGDHVDRPGLGRPAARRRGHRAADGRDADGHHRRGARHRSGAPPRRDARCADRSSWPPPRAGSCPSTSTRRTRRPAPRPWTPCSTADWVVLGPGSWYTSVIPHLLVPALRKALVETDARLLVVLNLEGQAGETHGYGPEDHLAALHEHGPDLHLHTVLADPRPSRTPSTLEQAVASWGARLEVADVGVGATGRRATTRTSWRRRSGRSSTSPTPRAPRPGRANNPLRGQGFEGC